MAFKFTVYESLRTLYTRLHGERPGVLEDLVMGGTAGETQMVNGLGVAMQSRGWNYGQGLYLGTGT